MAKGKCSVNDCAKASMTRGFCIAHYKRFLRHGDPLAGGLAKGSVAPFIEKALAWPERNKCLIWPYAKTAAGYGVFMRRKTTYAHVALCEKAHGPKPTLRHEVAHSCGVTNCVNPHHLRWATPHQNALDKRKHGTMPKGERHHWCKLSDQDVLDIWRLKGVNSPAEIARLFGVTRGYINSIFAGRTRLQIG